MAGRNGTKVMIDKSGRLVLPKRQRERLGIRSDGELEITDRPDGVLLRVAQERPAMVKISGLWVHQGAAPADADWKLAVERVREERIDSILKS
jgi:AbrB family looped-hinge helix DNA binding protein